VPTPTVKGNYNKAGLSKKSGDGLATWVKRWPTPAARDFRYPNKKTYQERGGGKKGQQRPEAVGGPLNPTWVEWLMGLPIGHTEL
jgi:DNA (cytosine-5)-methyltransferase 1